MFSWFCAQGLPLVAHSSAHISPTQSELKLEPANTQDKLSGSITTSFSHFYLNRELIHVNQKMMQIQMLGPNYGGDRKRSIRGQDAQGGFHEGLGCDLGRVHMAEVRSGSLCDSLGWRCTCVCTYMFTFLFWDVQTEYNVIASGNNENN